MQELIKYFESLEARMSALEEAQKANAEKLQVNEDKLLAIGERITAMMDILKEAQNKSQPAVVVVPEEPKVAEPEPMVEAEPEIEPEIQETQEIPEEPKEESIVEAPKKEVASPNATLYGKAVTDIRQAISLGDRFLYQRELFGQNAELMQRTLTELDALGSFEEAQAYISRFNWDTESATYQQFLITLHRRFG